MENPVGGQKMQEFNMIGMNHSLECYCGPSKIYLIS